MPRIKRTKLPPAGPDGRSPEPATHYAAAVDAGGGVTAWTPDRAKALVVGEATAALVRRHYAGRPNAGRVSAEGEAERRQPPQRPAGRGVPQETTIASRGEQPSEP